ncbi:hypothetical protein FK178_00285 [Antarcticibacterium arcticum]|uniref:Carboxypeptidase-like regulatory domain-containing protein n=1 Tax=Antarcticibacterium arcticum TaxID=2585771 RepID=A0A5B8YFC4_9FLAO|nr:hypothetical protein [Antarcticibacterium arcticum]QED36261.1 hypothetical protein FK178_00285 [Antarcticibacterium arcticum]
MKKLSFFMVFLLASMFLQAQTGERTLVNGSFTMPVGESMQGISVFNLNTNRGTVSNNAGKFSLLAGVNDSIRISSMQFQEFTIIVDKGVIDSQQLNIQINEVVNLLPEVIVSPYDLTGNVKVDISRMAVARVPDTLTAKNSMGLYFEADAAPDLQSMPRNEALAMSETRLVNGINFVNLFKEILITNKRDQVQRPEADINMDVRALFNDQFFKENFDIELRNINEFIYYADHNGLEEEMLKEGNELELIEFLLVQSKKFKKEQSKRN